jgi:hypothetical protein
MVTPFIMLRSNVACQMHMAGEDLIALLTFDVLVLGIVLLAMIVEIGFGVGTELAF